MPILMVFCKNETFIINVVVINLCEMKYTQQPYALDKSEAEKIVNRMAPLQTLNRKRHNVQCVLVTKQQAKQNSYYNSLVTKNITLSDLMND